MREERSIFPSWFQFTMKKENLPILIPKLMEVLNRLGKSYEMIFVDDGSTDRSREILKREGFSYIPKFTCWDSGRIVGRQLRMLPD